MARQPIGTPAIGVAEVPAASTPAASGSDHIPTLVLMLSSILAAVLPGAVWAGISSEAPRTGAPGMREPDAGSLLVEYYEIFLRDRDIEAFRQHVSGRYTEGTLARLIESGSLNSRRAAVLALGFFGTYRSNAGVARALRDDDPTVRDLAENALWAIWFRADTPENNAMLEQVRLLIRNERLAEAVKLASRLIARAPNFAEAYNQRAIAHFSQGHFEESADDCRRVLERNPYHIGALGGLAQCQLELDQPGEALRTLRRALRLQPFSTGLRNAVNALETEGE